MTAVFRENVTDKEQTDLENAEFENSVAVFEDGKTRVVVRGNLGGAERVAHVSGTLHKNAGVVMSISDKPGRFTEETIGKA